MKIRLFFIFLIVLTVWSRSLHAQTNDPYCHVEVISGSPAIFNFVTSDDYNNGKVLTYSTYVRVFYFKTPRNWALMVKSGAPNFDGPSTMPVNIVTISVEQLLYNGTFSVDKNGTVVGWSSVDNSILTSDGTSIATGYATNPALYPETHSLTFVVRFSCSAHTTEGDTWNSVLDKLPGYYASQACFYMQSYYD